MGNKSNNLLLGALEMLILKALVSEDRHGWGISKRLKQISSGTFSLNIGSLYPALYRLEKKGLVESYPALSEKGRDARFYTLLPKGKKHLEDQLANWREFSIAVEAVILS
jgi:PadR family transcriptional regulator PadR